MDRCDWVNTLEVNLLAPFLNKVATHPVKTSEGFSSKY